jgi:hypothetical protein
MMDKNCNLALKYVCVIVEGHVCSMLPKKRTLYNGTVLPLKFQDPFGEYLASDMYLFACRIKIKMKQFFPTSNCTIITFLTNTRRVPWPPPTCSKQEK